MEENKENKENIELNLHEKNDKIPQKRNNVNTGLISLELVARINKIDIDMKAIVRQLKDAYYEANKEALQAQGIKSSYGAFFPKAKDKLCIPQTVNVNGKEYNYNKETTTKAGEVSKDYKGATLKSQSNPFTH